MTRTVRAYGQQEVPDRFADDLRRMLAAGDLRLNVVLVEARQLGWRTKILADVLGLRVSAVSKRMERAVAPPWDRNLREVAAATLRDLQRHLTDEELHKELFGDLEYLVQVRIGTNGVQRDDVEFVAARAREELARLAQPLTGVEKKKLMTLHNRLLRAVQYTPTASAPPVEVADAQHRWCAYAHAAVTAATVAATKTDPEHVGASDRDQALAVLGQAAQLLTAAPDDVDRQAVGGLLDEARLALAALQAGVTRKHPQRAQTVRRLVTASVRLRLAREYQPSGVVVAGVDIPAPPVRPTTLAGDFLTSDEIAELRRLQSIAVGVNGTTMTDSPEWAASEELSRRLHGMLAPPLGEGTLSAYYVAKALGLTHRAVVTRVERWLHRQENPVRRERARPQVTAVPPEAIAVPPEAIAVPPEAVPQDSAPAEAA